MAAATKITPSMLSLDFANLASEAERMVRLGADWLHMDVMVLHSLTMDISSFEVHLCYAHPSPFPSCRMDTLISRSNAMLASEKTQAAETISAAP
ncbi:hypothetical protein ZWY2020_002475 [Hordeum vulgare]|nr:hypothetical protein ZWY2020_002475 [Hordeum vulgare]